MKTNQIYYALGFGLAGASTLFLVVVIGAVGLIGVEGDLFDAAYGAVIAVGVLGAMAARFAPLGMARTLFAMGLAQAVIAAIALIVGKQQSPVSSVFDIVRVNGFFVVLFTVAGVLFLMSLKRATPDLERASDHE